MNDVQDGLRDADSIRAAEDERFFEVVDKLLRPCRRCRICSSEYGLNETDEHESEDICDHLVSESVLET